MIVQIMSGTVSIQLINNLQRHEVSKLYTVMSMQGSNMESSDRESNFDIFINMFILTTTELQMKYIKLDLKETGCGNLAWNLP
jgi:hypothetical protein